MNSYRQIAVLVEFGPLLHWARLLSATLYRNLCGLTDQALSREHRQEKLLKLALAAPAPLAGCSALLATAGELATEPDGAPGRRHSARPPDCQAHIIPPSANALATRWRRPATSCQPASLLVSQLAHAVEHGANSGGGLEEFVLERARIWLFVNSGLHLNVMFNAPISALFEEHLATVKQSLDTILPLPQRDGTAKQTKAEDLSWYRRLSLLYSKLGAAEASRTLALEGLAKHPDDPELKKLAGR